MDEREKQIRRRLRDDFEHYASRCLKIRSKSGEIKPFLLNKAQRYVHEKVERQKLVTGKVRVIILKGRQMGLSTLIEGRFYWLVTHHFGLRAFILTHDKEATNNLFDMAKRYHDYCPTPVRPTVDASNSKELIFGGLQSGYKVGTAGNKAVGRSSTIQLLHSSEVAYQPHAAEHAKGILQAVPNEPGTEIFFESTANGVSNYFHQQWQMAESGQSDFIPIFVPWNWQDEYSLPIDPDFKVSSDEAELMELYGISKEQVAWRRNKIGELSVGGMDGEKAFYSEYPFNPTQAFQESGEDSFIPPYLVMPARKASCEGFGPVIIGVDPARFGDDRTAIVRRQGRKAFGLQTFLKKDTMEIAGIVHLIITREKPFKVCIDVCGLGAGVYDRLKELGHGEVIVPVNSANKPLNDEIYKNKRAELYGLMKDWLRDSPCQVPDSDEFHADMCGVKYSVDSKGRLLLEGKDKMKARGVRSSDCADGLSLTFAVPPSAYNNLAKERDRKISQAISSNYDHIQSLREKAYGNRG